MILDNKHYGLQKRIRRIKDRIAALPVGDSRIDNLLEQLRSVNQALNKAKHE